MAHEFCIYRTPFEDCGYPSTVKLDDGSFLTVFYAYPRRGVPAALTGVKWRMPHLGDRQWQRRVDVSR